MYAVSAEDPRWQLVQRVASSRHFAKAPQLRNFLLFIAARTVEGRESEISEYTIGFTVLGRHEHFNPSEDNIVRVQARHLRKKIEDYFASEGRDEPLVITIPKGGYIPHFELRPAAPAAQAEEDAAQPLESQQRKPAVPWRTRLIWMLAGGTIAAAGLFGALWLQTGPRQRAPDHAVLSRVFQGGRETHIVVADSCLVALQDILQTDITLQEYTDPHFLPNLLERAANRPLRAALEKLYSRQYTSLGDLNVASRLLERSSHYSDGARLRFARHVNLREFKSGNFVLIGSRRGIPWVQLFESKLNFLPRWEAHTGQFYYENRAPNSGEPSEYGRGRPVEAETYATVVLLPNLSRTGNVLMLIGLTMEGTEAAGEFATGGEAPQELAQILGPPGNANRYVEILLRFTVAGGAARDPTLLASRSKPIGSSK